MRAWFWIAVALLAACDDETGSRRDDVPEDSGPPTVCEATGEPIREETCNGSDDDCDGRFDEDFDLEADPQNCGRCDNVCAFGNALVACVDATCRFAGCPPGRADANGDQDDGCEAQCAAVPGDERCDQADNDCDGRADEDFDLTLDLNHCGACGNACRYERGQALCDEGECRLARCDPGFGDLNGDPRDGCEAPCTPRRPGPELCDGEDNDCDGASDEEFDLASDGEHCGRCDRRCAFANAAGRCDAGECALARCEAGFVDADGQPDNGCEARCQPTNGGLEVCDTLDNDCNGIVDDGFDTQGDVENCGGCGEQDERYVCRLPNAENACEAGRCVVERCIAGFADVDGWPDNGCETACVVTGDEVCDTTDNDCDGEVDEGFDIQSDLAHCGACDRLCETGNAEPRCVDGRCRIAACPEGMADADRDPLNGCELACVPTENPAEVCDEVDNDCDGHTDEGFDLTGDLAHCGACNQPCAAANALPLCDQGRCDLGGCDPGWSDADGLPENGCELECVPSADVIEVCNATDDDCDGQTDEDFDLQGDPLHCGACDRVCSYLNGRVECRAGECERVGCQPGWSDANGDPEDGCEYRCVPTEDPSEVCDRQDNDCDGDIDEGFDLLGSLDHCGACGAPCRHANATSVCDEGTCRLANCLPGFADADRSSLTGCESRCVGSPDDPEVCDEADDDCDGRVDEDFDLARDVDHCGECNRACDLANAEPLCNGGVCQIRRCDVGFVDLDRDGDNGCECRLTNGGLEVCDDVDNDCNGVVDDPARVAPPPGFDCLPAGVCAGTRPRCDDGAWVCPYPATYEAREASCDGVDNDCDGDRDEEFAGLGRPCQVGVGVCAETGTLRCTAAGDDTECSAAPRPDRAGAETCNDRDDDCDGDVDEDSQIVVRVPGGNGVAAFTIFAHEASRPDASGITAGDSFARACSKPGVLPWAFVDYATALAACQSAGFNLCSAAQWQRACEGDPRQAYPYGARYSALQCNGQDYDADRALGGNQDLAIATAALPECRRAWGAAGSVFDQSGNLWEWTREDVSAAGDGSARALRGGSFGNVDGGLTCTFRNATPINASRSNVGFRCCTP